MTSSHDSYNADKINVYSTQSTDIENVLHSGANIMEARKYLGCHATFAL